MWQRALPVTMALCLLSAGPALGQAKQQVGTLACQLAGSAGDNCKSPKQSQDSRLLSVVQRGALVGAEIAGGVGGGLLVLQRFPRNLPPTVGTVLLYLNSRILGVAGGVYLTGRLFGENGSFRASVVGAAGGIVVAFMFNALQSHFAEGQCTLQNASFVVTSAVLSALLFNLSEDISERER